MKGPFVTGFPITMTRAPQAANAKGAAYRAHAHTFAVLRLTGNKTGTS
jgi:hypothetical protein